MLSFQAMNPQPSLTYHQAGIPLLINKKCVRQKHVSVPNHSMKRNYERRAGLLTLVSHDDRGQGGRVVCLEAPFGLLKGKEKKPVKTAFTVYLLASFKKPGAEREPDAPTLPLVPHSPGSQPVTPAVLASDPAKH